MAAQATRPQVQTSFGAALCDDLGAPGDRRADAGAIGLSTAGGDLRLLRPTIFSTIADVDGGAFLVQCRER